MSAARIPQIKWLIRTLTLDTAEQLSREALACGYPADIRARVGEVLQAAGLGELVNHNTHADGDSLIAGAK
jgi:signal transduction protein with GAF and PtsI domain